MLQDLKKRIQKTPVITAGGGGYSAADVVGGAMVLSLANPGGGGFIRKLVIADDDDEKAAMNLWVFSANLATPVADNGAFAPVIDDLKNLIDIIPIAATDYTTINGNAYAIWPTASTIRNTIDFSVEENLYVYAVCVGTPTYTAVTDLTFTFLTWLDA